MKLRDVAVGLVIFSVVESLAVNALVPQWRPVGGVGRLVERFFLLNFVLYVLYSILVYPFLVSPLRHLPSPRGGNLVTGQSLMVRSTSPPGEAIRRWMEDIPNDGLIRLRAIGGKDAIVVTSPAMLKQVLVDNTYDYEKQPKIANILRRVLGDGLILVEGNVHKFQRKHLLPSFQVSVIRDLYPLFWAKAVEMTQMLREEAARPEFEFGVWCTRVTLDIIGIAGFGRDFNSLKNPDDPFVADYQELLEPAPEKALYFVLSLLISPNLVLGLPLDIPRRLSRISKALYQFAYNMARDRRAELSKKSKLDAPSSGSPDPSAAARRDILSLLVESNDFSDAELAHQVLTMMAAGHETTSNSLGWCAFLLAQKPEIQGRLRAELRGALPSPDDVGTHVPSAADLDALPLLNGVVNETLRLYPTVPLTTREVVRETRLGGERLPVGSQVFICPWAINRNSAIWGEGAQDFRPERWVNADGKPNNTGGTTNNYSIMTFLHGPRSCIGQGFARSEMKCLVAAVVGRYNIEFTREKQTYYPAGLVTTKAAHGMWLKFTEVEGW